jgi:hypothetical protein
MPTQKLRVVFRLPSLLKTKKDALHVNKFSQRKQQILLEHLTGGYQNSIEEFNNH